jgi:hypothetical protein
MEPERDVRWKLWAETFRAWVPIVVSLCAISLTVFQAAATRRHARLSVQPRVDLRIELNDSAGTVLLSMVNVGFGPAIVTNVAFVVDGERVPATGPDACAEIDRRLGRGGEAWDNACFTSDEHVLRPGDSVVIYGSRPAPAHAAEDHAAAAVDFRRLAASARYCSFFEDCWEVRAD